MRKIIIFYFVILCSLTSHGDSDDEEFFFSDDEEQNLQTEELTSKENTNKIFTNHYTNSPLKKSLSPGPFNDSYINSDGSISIRNLTYISDAQYRYKFILQPYVEDLNVVCKYFLGPNATYQDSYGGYRGYTWNVSTWAAIERGTIQTRRLKEVKKIETLFFVTCRFPDMVRYVNTHAKKVKNKSEKLSPDTTFTRIKFKWNDQKYPVSSFSNADGLCKNLGYQSAVDGSRKVGHRRDKHVMVKIDENGRFEKKINSRLFVESISCINTVL